MKKLKQARATKLKYLVLSIAFIIGCVTIGSTYAASHSVKHTITATAGVGTLAFAPLGMTRLAPEPGGDQGGDAQKVLDECRKAAIESVAKLVEENPAIKNFKILDDKFKSFEEQAKGFKTEEDFKKLTKELTDIGLDLKALKDSSSFGNRMNQSLKFQIAEQIKAKHADILKIYKAKAGEVTLELKTFTVAEPMWTTSASNPDGIPELIGVQTAPPGNVNLRTAIVRELVSSLNTDRAAYSYTETVPKDGNYAFLGEGDEKPLIDFKIQTRYAEPKKVAAHMELSEEAITDIPNMQSIAYDYLRKKHDLKWQNGILFGDGTGDNPKGATTYGRAFVAGDMLHRVTTPNILDVINAAITDMYTTHNYQDEMPYMANIVMMNPIDFFVEFVSKKDGFGHPLYPTASLFNRVVIGGVTIIPFEDITPDHIFVADMSKYNVTNYVPYTVRIGWINDQFITNQFCIVGESRFHAFVRKLDEQAFIYDRIDIIRNKIDIAAT